MRYCLRRLDACGSFNRVSAKQRYAILFISGSGVKVKALTLLASGLPVIATSEGVQGIDVKDEVDCLIADDPLSFSACIERLCSDPSLGDFLQENAYEFIRENFSSERQNEILGQIIGEAIRSHGSREYA